MREAEPTTLSLMADAGQLEHTLVNLIENAVAWYGETCTANARRLSTIGARMVLTSGAERQRPRRCCWRSTMFALTS